MLTDPDAVRVLCFGDSNTHGSPAGDPDYVRLGPDVRWTGRLQRLLGDGYEVIEEGLAGRTTDVDYADRPHCNGHTYFAPCLMTHHPLDVVVVMLGTNDLKACFDRTAETIANALHKYVDDAEAYVTDRQGRAPAVLLVSPVHVHESVLEYADPAGDSIDARGVAVSRELATEMRRVARERGALFADATSVARAGGDGVHLTLDSQAPLAGLVAGLIRP